MILPQCHKVLSLKLPATKVPEYLENQKQGRWDRGDMMSMEDAVSKKVYVALCLVIQCLPPPLLRR